MTGNQRAANRVYFERIASMRDMYHAFDLSNRVVPADEWTPDTSALEVKPTVVLDTPVRFSVADAEHRPTRGITRFGRGGLM